MSQVPKLCNDMMNLGRLQGYEVCPLRLFTAGSGGSFKPDRQSLLRLQGKLTSQGKLLQQETFFVTEQDAGVLSRSKERRVFLFEQIVIFSELLRKGSSTPGYQFKKSIKVRPECSQEQLWVPAMLEPCPRQVSYLGLEESVDNDPCKFVLSCRGSSERFTLQAANVDIKQVWVRHIQALLDDQSKFLYGEEMRSERRRLFLDLLHVDVLSVCDLSAPVSHRVPEGQDRSRKQLLADQKPLVLREPTRHVQPSVLSRRTRRQGDREGEEPDESVHFQRRVVLFPVQGEFLESAPRQPPPPRSFTLLARMPF